MRRREQYASCKPPARVQSPATTLAHPAPAQNATHQRWLMDRAQRGWNPREAIPAMRIVSLPSKAQGWVFGRQQAVLRGKHSPRHSRDTAAPCTCTQTLPASQTHHVSIHSLTHSLTHSITGRVVETLVRLAGDHAQHGCARQRLAGQREPRSRGRERGRQHLGDLGDTDATALTTTGDTILHTTVAQARHDCAKQY